MEYRKIINCLDNKLNQPSKFRTKNWVERGTYNTGSHVKYKISMIWSSLCDYNDVFIFYICWSRTNGFFYILCQGLNTEVLVPLVFHS